MSCVSPETSLGKGRSCSQNVYRRNISSAVCDYMETSGSAPESRGTSAWLLWTNSVVLGVGRCTLNSEEVEVVGAVVCQATGRNTNPDFLDR